MDWSVLGTIAVVLQTVLQPCWSAPGLETRYHKDSFSWSKEVIELDAGLAARGLGTTRTHEMDLVEAVQEAL